MQLSTFLIILQCIIMIMFFVYMVNNSGNQTKQNKDILDKENEKGMESLNKLKAIKLSQPLTEKSRPTDLNEIIGQEEGIMALKAALCGPNPQHVIIYGPPGIGKTAAARVVLEEAKRMAHSPFNLEAKFVEIDATTLRFDERGIADPLIGSVHDPIYQGAGALGIAGVPQPKPGAVTKAHGGILFIDEIGELHPIELNKLLKVLEDRKVFLDSSYYSSENPNIPTYIKEIFDNGLPADFRLIGATTRNPEEIVPAIRSRCVEIFFKPLENDEIIKIAENAVEKVGFKINEDGLKTIGKYCSNGREVVNLIQLCVGLATNDNREYITLEDINWTIENGQYSPRIDNVINENPEIGIVNGLAVYGANMGALMEIEATAIRKNFKRKGILKVTGIVEDEEISTSNKKMKRKSTAYCSVQNVLTVLNNICDIRCDEYDIHVNFPGGMPVDGPSAGISIITAIYSAICKKVVNNKIAMTGEISLKGTVKAIGGVNAKIMAAKKAGVEAVIIPKDNWNKSFENIDNIKIIPVNSVKEVLEIAIINEELNSKIKDTNNNDNIEIIAAKSLK